jgi:crotonobetainyl-CoA:carnitine CoA-transferase CaiB-like acyl-CoA transferase
MFARLLRAMGRGDLEGDARLATTPARLERRAEVNDLVGRWVAGLDAEVALAALEAAEVPSCLVASVADLAADPQVAARENILRLAVPLLGTLAMPGVVPRLTRTPGRVSAPGPRTPGQHNEEVYGGRLGLGRAALARLRERGVI